MALMSSSLPEHASATSSTGREVTQTRHLGARQDNISGPDLGQQSMTLCRLTLFTRSPDQPENRADVRVFIRIAGVADIDHVYRRPADPAHVGLLQQGGVCITHDPV
jgi:hypothetical protein